MAEPWQSLRFQELVSLGSWLFCPRDPNDAFPSPIDCSLVTPSHGQLRALKPKTYQPLQSPLPPPNYPSLKVDRKSYSYRDPSHRRSPSPERPAMSEVAHFLLYLPFSLTSTMMTPLAQPTCLKSLPLQGRNHLHLGLNCALIHDSCKGLAPPLPPPTLAELVLF